MDTAIDIALKFAAITVAFVVVLLIVAYTVLAERRVLGLIQGRLGPNRVGYGGFLNTVPVSDQHPGEPVQVFLAIDAAARSDAAR